MNEQANVQKVQEMYQAFGRGDIETIVGALDSEVEWIIPGDADMPFVGHRRGPQQVAEFFRLLGEAVEYEQFEPQEYIAQNDMVVVTGMEKGRIKSTGDTMHSEWAMVWKFRDGKVLRFRMYEDMDTTSGA